MKGKTCHTIAEITNLIMCTILCISLLYWGEAAAKREIGPFGAPVIGLMFIACYAMRMAVANFILYAVLHLVPYGLLMLLPVAAGRYELMAFYTALVVLDLSYWMKRRNDGFMYVHIAFVLINAIGYLYASIKGFDALRLLLFVLGILYFALYYVRLFFANAATLAKERGQDEKMPFSDMLENSFKVAYPFVCASILVMILAKTDSLDPYALAAYRFFMTIMGKALGFAIWLFSLIAGLFIEGAEELPGDTVERTMEAAHHSVIVEILFTLLYIVLLATAAYLFIRHIISLIKLIPMRRKIEPTIIEEGGMIEIRERIEKTGRKKEEKLPPVRKRYKKTIEKAMKKGYGLNRSHTVRERALDFMDKRGEDISALSAEYEAARYRL